MKKRHIYAIEVMGSLYDKEKLHDTGFTEKETNALNSIFGDCYNWGLAVTSSYYSSRKKAMYGLLLNLYSLTSRYSDFTTSSTSSKDGKIFELYFEETFIARFEIKSHPYDVIAGYSDTELQDLIELCK